MKTFVENDEPGASTRSLPETVRHFVELIRFTDVTASKRHVFRPWSRAAGGDDQFDWRPTSRT